MAGGVLEFYAQQSLITDPGPYASELDALPRRVDALVRVVQGCSSTRWPRRGAGCLLRSAQPRMQFVSDRCGTYSSSLFLGDGGSRPSTPIWLRCR
jgi:hypothetical protein